jgi:NitT/TauT family transport system permease protein
LIVQEVTGGAKKKERASAEWKHRLLWLRALGPVVVVIGAWQLCASTRLVNPVFTSSPYQVAIAAYQFLPTHAGLTDMATSGQEFAYGFVLACIVGVGLGLLIGRYRAIEDSVSLGLNMFYAMPIIALAPVVVVWFGIGLLAKVLIVFMSGVFPILVNTSLGVKQVDRSLIAVARVYRAKEWRIWRSVLIPGAVPSILAGIRLGMLTSLIGTIVAEFVVSSSGIGFLILQASQDVDIALVFAGLLVIVIASLILTFILGWLQARVAAWKTS